ncbi:MAG: hypothetical protein AB7U18_26225, partial [Dehalococcoidia bacterium]
PDIAVEQTLPPGHGGYAYLIEGAVELNGERLTTGDAVYITGDGLVRIRAEQPSELLLVDTPLQRERT